MPWNFDRLEAHGFNPSSKGKQINRCRIKHCSYAVNPATFQMKGPLSNDRAKTLDADGRISII